MSDPIYAEEAPQRFSDKEQSVMMAFQRVLGTPEGKAVMVHILNELRFYKDELKTVEDMALHNAAIRIWKKCGVWFPDNAFNITDKLMELSII